MSALPSLHVIADDDSVAALCSTVLGTGEQDRQGADRSSSHFHEAFPLAPHTHSCTSPSLLHYPVLPVHDALMPPSFLFL